MEKVCYEISWSGCNSQVLVNPVRGDSELVELSNHDINPSTSAFSPELVEGSGRTVCTSLYQRS